MATFNYNKVNLAAAQIPSAITASQTSITVDASESALFPPVPFFATIMPAGGVPNTLNSEIVQVTANNTSTGVLTIARAQRGTTAKAQDEGAVIINGVYVEDLAQSQAVGLAFFSATYASFSASYSYWDIDSAMLPTEPTNGMSIRVVFGADTLSPAARLRLNGGTYQDVYAGVGLTATASNVNTTTPFHPKIGIIYELVYYNNAWYAMNAPANNSITSDSIDFATLPYMIATLNSNPTIIDGTRIQFDGFEQDGGFVSTNQNSVFEVPVTGLYELSAALGVGKYGTSDVSAYCRVRYCSSSGESGDTIFTLYEQGSGNYAKSSCPSYLVRINAGSFIGLFSNTSGTIGLGSVGPTFLSLRFLRP